MIDSTAVFPVYVTSGFKRWVSQLEASKVHQSVGDGMVVHPSFIYRLWFFSAPSGGQTFIVTANRKLTDAFFCKGRIIAPKKAQVVQQQKLKKVRMCDSKSEEFHREYRSELDFSFNWSSTALLLPEGSRGCHQEQDRAGGDSEGQLLPPQAAECD